MCTVSEQSEGGLTERQENDGETEMTDGAESGYEWKPARHTPYPLSVA